MEMGKLALIGPEKAYLTEVTEKCIYLIYIQ